ATRSRSCPSTEPRVAPGVTRPTRSRRARPCPPRSLSLGWGLVTDIRIPRRGFARRGSAASSTLLIAEHRSDRTLHLTRCGHLAELQAHNQSCEATRKCSSVCQRQKPPRAPKAPPLQYALFRECLPPRLPDLREHTCFVSRRPSGCGELALPSHGEAVDA